MRRRRINIACIQETRWKGKKAKELDDFKLWYTGESNRSGVGIIVDKNLKNDVVDVKRFGDRIIAIKLVLEKEVVNIVSAYAPQVGLDASSKLQFWEDMDELVQGIRNGEKIIIGGDLNGHVGRDRRGYDDVHGGYGFGEKNEEGISVLDFAVAYDLAIVNTYFKKRDEHLITFKNGSNSSQIDFFLTRRSDRLLCKDCKVIPGESLTTQHRLLIMDICLLTSKSKNAELSGPRIKWWRLKGEALKTFTANVIKQGKWELEGDTNTMWNEMKTCIKKIAKDILGVSSGKRHTPRETWWWNDEVQAAIKAKKDSFKVWQKTKDVGDLTTYKLARTNAKKVVGNAKMKKYDDLYNNLNTKEGEKAIYKIAKTRERKSRDFEHVRCIKNIEGKVIVKDAEIADRWKEYFSGLLNEGSSDNNAIDGNPTCNITTGQKYVRRIRESEVKDALRKMQVGKATGPDEIPIEVWKSLGIYGVSWLTKLFNKIMTAKKIPDEWRRSIVVPIYKNKGDIQSCNNYRGIKLMSHTMKLWERVIETRLRQETSISENQFGFMPGRSTTEAIYLLRRLLERFRTHKKDLHMVFIDLEKAYDRIPRALIWQILEKRGVSSKYVDIIKDMYFDATSSVRTVGGQGEEFPITIGLHQGSALSPYLFALIMDDLTRDIQDEVPWCMLFADDIVLVDETSTGINRKLEHWRSALESKGLKISRTKTEYMVCNFSNTRLDNEVVKIDEREIPQSDSFRYLGSIINKEGDIEDDVVQRIKVGWTKWRGASGVLCDRRIPLKLKGKFYRTVIRPAMMYGAECWAVKKRHLDKLSVAEMRMLRWMCGKTRKDKIRNDRFRADLGIAPIQDKLRESRLRWYGHVQRRTIDAPVRRSDQIHIEGPKRTRGRPKITLEEVVKKDMHSLGLVSNMTSNRTVWRARIHVADPI